MFHIRLVAVEGYRRGHERALFCVKNMGFTVIGRVVWAMK